VSGYGARLCDGPEGDSGDENISSQIGHVRQDKFGIRHCPFRSQRRGEREVLQERKPRYGEGERAPGWSRHYDHVSAGPSFLCRPEDLIPFDERPFYETLPVERVSVVGVGGGRFPAVLNMSRAVCRFAAPPAV
jgi:hypothetical protein